MKRLTKPQKQQVEKYCKMAFWFVNKNPELICKDGKDDTYQDALLLVCKAAKAHDKKRAKCLSTLIHLKFTHELKDIKKRRNKCLRTMKQDDLAHMVDSGCLEDITQSITKQENDAEQQVERKEISSLVRDAISSLSKREQLALRARYGIGESDYFRELLIYEDVGEILGGVGKERARQIIVRAMRKLRERLANCHPDLFQDERS